MAEHQDLGVLGRLRPGEQGDPAENTKKNQVEQTYGHRSHPAGAQAPVPAKPQIRLCDTVTGTHRAKRHSRIPSLNPAYHNSVAVSPTGGAVYVTGITDSAGTSGGGYDTIAYNAATGAQLWAKRYASIGGANSVAVSPDGTTVFVTGPVFRSARGTGYGTVAYNAATGAQLWAKSHVGAVGAVPRAVAYSVAVSPSGGTVYVTGLSWKPGWDYATIAYNAITGAQQWIKLYHGPGSGDSLAYAMAVSPTSGTVIVTGGSASGKYATVAYSG